MSPVFRVIKIIVTLIVLGCSTGEKRVADRKAMKLGALDTFQCKENEYRRCTDSQVEGCCMGSGESILRATVEYNELNETELQALKEKFTADNVIAVIDSLYPDNEATLLQKLISVNFRHWDNNVVVHIVFHGSDSFAVLQARSILETILLNLQSGIPLATLKKEGDNDR